MSSKRGWIGVDLDGTLALYDYWRGPAHIGEPIERMMQRVRKWLAEGREVKIFTARVSGDRPEVEIARRAIQRWLAIHRLPELEITHCKDYQMVELWDDRAVGVIPNTGEER